MISESALFEYMSYRSLYLFFVFNSIPMLSGNLGFGEPVLVESPFVGLETELTLATARVTSEAVLSIDDGGSALLIIRLRLRLRLYHMIAPCLEPNRAEGPTPLSNSAPLSPPTTNNERAGARWLPYKQAAPVVPWIGK